MTTEVIRNRLLSHIQAYCAGQYWIPRPDYLDKICAADELPEDADERYLYRLQLPSSFVNDHLPGIERGDLGREIATFIRRLSFFVAPLEDLTKEELLDRESVLIERARGECPNVLDSGDSPRAVEQHLRQISVQFLGARVVGLQALT